MPREVRGRRGGGAAGKQGRNVIIRHNVSKQSITYVLGAGAKNILDRAPGLLRVHAANAAGAASVGREHGALPQAGGRGSLERVDLLPD